ncbi:MAG: hypothetical protein J5I64_07120 [Saprospiraceae bacterium]|jgi:very-short-patch-repair endonuclease|nr:hypothetical protein [Saprospiraceae bacterium]
MNPTKFPPLEWPKGVDNGDIHEVDIRETHEEDYALPKVGYTTLRFSSWEVLNRIVDVSIVIGDWIKENRKTHPNPTENLPFKTQT